MNVTPASIPEVLIIEPKVYGDERGFFLETWQKSRYQQAGIDSDFVQDNLSFSRRGILRGLHFQYENTQGKLVYVLQGSVFDVAVDIRRNSPTFGHWVGQNLTSENKLQMFIPPGFAHGFCVTSETALFMYKCTDYYNPAAEITLAWNDPAIGIDWPITAPVLSEKDQQALTLEQIPKNKLHVF